MGNAILLIIYGTLVEVGGIIGFVKARSRPSLISGISAGALLTASGVMVLLNVPIGTYLGLFVTIALCAIFAWRFVKTKALMPSGMMLLISIIVALILLAIMFLPRS